MSRAARLVELLVTLRSKPRFSVQELATALGVSRRTMLRDLHELSAMGVPLMSTPGPHGGYALIADRRMLPLSLSADEAIAIVLSYEAFLQYAQSPFSAQSMSAITKLRDALPPDVVRDLDRIREHVVISDAQRRYDAPLLHDLLQATLDGAHLRVVYDSRSGTSERVIYPFGLYAANGYWYCACFDYQRRANLSLRADRFIAASRAEGYARPEVAPLRQWLAEREQHAVEPLSLRATVTERGRKLIDLRALFGPSLIDDGGAIQDVIPAGEVEFFAAQLLPLGRELVIESPPQLIDALRRKAQEIIALYDDGSQASA